MQIAKSSVLVATMFACLALAQIGNSQESEASTGLGAIVEEIVVTSARRKNVAEDAQSVPISVSAFTQNQLDAMQFANLEDITARVPNANAETNSTYPGFVNFNIRGMGVRGSALSDEPTVGVFIDGVYQGVSAGGLFDTFDMESVEVLRGPQGTLFGRNVTGGAVLMRTTAPSEEFKAKLKASAGNYGAYGLSGVITGPLQPDLLGKFAFFYNQRDDYIDAINKGNPLAPNAGDLGEKDQVALRGALTWLGDNFTATIRAEHMQTDEDPVPTDNAPGRTFDASGLNALFGALSPNGIIAPEFGDYEKHGSDTGVETPRSELTSASLDVTWNFGEATLQSITAWRDFSQEGMEQDFDNSLVPLFEIWEHEVTQEQISQEFIYNTSISEALSLTAGLYYFDQEITNNDFRISGGAFGGRGAHILYATEQSVLGVFASAEWTLTERLNLTLAGRYTTEEKDATMSNANAFAASGGTVGCPADGAPSILVTGMNPRDSINFSTCTPSYMGNEQWSNFTPKLALQYFVSEDTQAYATYSKGFRSGGFSTRVGYGSDPVFDEEQVDAYEVGLKHDFPAGARVNLALFQNEYSDLQENIFLSIATGEQVTRNAAEATVKGAEIEGLVLIADRLLIQGSLGFLDAEYDKYSDGREDFSGKTLRSIPEQHRDLSVSYEIPIGNRLSLTLRGSYHYRDEFHNTANNMGYVSPDRELFNASISLGSTDDRWKLTAFGKNLTDNASEGAATDVGVWVVTVGYVPRTYGVELVYEFN